MWGMGSTLTGPMFEGGDARCRKGHYDKMPDLPTRPSDENDFRAIIIVAQKCKDYEQVDL